jgi:hypothetical protein
MGWHGGTVVYNRNVYVSRSNIYAGGNRYYNGNWARPTPYNSNYNRNNYNRNNYNRNNVTQNNITVNNINNNNVNRNYVNNNNVNRNNVNNNNINRNNVNNNRTNTNVNRPTQPARPQNNPSRGYGQTASPGTKTGAFSGYSAGGNARAESSRGRQSYGGGNRGGGGGGRRR